MACLEVVTVFSFWERPFDIRVFTYPVVYVMRSISILYAAMVEAAARAPCFSDSPYRFDSGEYKLRCCMVHHTYSFAVCFTFYACFMHGDSQEHVLRV
jgi:hypothetical protein